MAGYSTTGSITINSILTSGTYQGLEATANNPIVIGNFENPNPFDGGKLWLNLIIFNKENPLGKLYTLPEAWINRQNNTWYYAIGPRNKPANVRPHDWIGKRIQTLLPGQQYFRAVTSYDPWPGVSNNGYYITTSNLITYIVYSDPVKSPTVAFSITKNTLKLYATEDVGSDNAWNAPHGIRPWRGKIPKPIWTCQYALVTWNTTNANSTVCVDKNYNLQVSSDSVKKFNINYKRGLIFLPGTYLKKYDSKINNGRKDSEGRTNYEYNIGFIISGPAGTINASLPFNLWTNGPMAKPLIDGDKFITPEEFFWNNKICNSVFGWGLPL